MFSLDIQRNLLFWESILHEFKIGISDDRLKKNLPFLRIEILLFPLFII